MNLKEKYNKYPMVTYKTVAHPGIKKGKMHQCSLCGKEFHEPMLRSDCQVVCSHCTMGLADAIDKNKTSYINLESLLNHIKEGNLKKFRATNGLSRADIGRYIRISPKYLQRIENIQSYPIDRLVKAIKKKIDTVHSSVQDH